MDLLRDGFVEICNDISYERKETVGQRAESSSREGERTRIPADEETPANEARQRVVVDEKPISPWTGSSADKSRAPVTFGRRGAARFANARGRERVDSRLVAGQDDRRSWKKRGSGRKTSRG